VDHGGMGERKGRDDGASCIWIKGIAIRKRLERSVDKSLLRMSRSQTLCFDVKLLRRGNFMTTVTQSP
jgi:hypothetical protein